jgi:starch synthase
MNVVFVASEAVPFAKTGGLGDVVGALPRALAKQGHNPCLFLPCYKRVWTAAPEPTGSGITLQVPVGARQVPAHVYASALPESDVPVYLIDQPRYFDRDGIYGVNGTDYADNCERFVFFNRAVMEAIAALGIRPDIVHCHDWQAGLIPVYLKTLYRRAAAASPPGTLLTIHNLAYLGLFGHWEMTLTGLEWTLFNWRQLEFHGKLCFMKAGLVFADKLTTVSPTYAKEIQSSRFGSGLEGLLRYRSADLRGIVNGIDTELWTPSRESMLAQRYDAASIVEGKARCKAWLQQYAGLPVRPEIPLCAQIGRLDPQKGWDLLAQVADRLLRQDVQLVVLGEGHPKYHALLQDLVLRYPDRFWAHLGFAPELAHQIEAGADIFLMPSLFEPCGLNQLYSLAHGTVPIVRATGGLADTVVDATPATLAEGTATGFMFTEPTSDALWHAIERALALWPMRADWLRVARTGMNADWSWDRSAVEYVKIYQEILRKARGRHSLPDGSEPSALSPAPARTA